MEVTVVANYRSSHAASPQQMKISSFIRHAFRTWDMFQSSDLSEESRRFEGLN
jgi:hypothetical protein